MIGHSEQLIRMVFKVKILFKNQEGICACSSGALFGNKINFARERSEIIVSYVVWILPSHGNSKKLDVFLLAQSNNHFIIMMLSQKPISCISR